MKNGILLCYFLFFAIISMKAQEWQTDLNEAKKIASEKNQNIILVFQGSDWCAPCIKLDTEIWSTTEFTAYSKEHFVMLKADFPRKSKNKLDILLATSFCLRVTLAILMGFYCCYHSFRTKLMNGS